MLVVIKAYGGVYARDILNGFPFCGREASGLPADEAGRLFRGTAPADAHRPAGIGLCLQNLTYTLLAITITEQ